MLIWRGWGGLVPLLVLISAAVSVYLDVAGITSQTTHLVFGGLLLLSALVVHRVGRRLNKALEERYGIFGRKFRLRDVFEVDDWTKPAEPAPSGFFRLPVEVTTKPFHSFMFIRMEYCAFLLLVAAIAAFFWNFLPSF
jgi:hypothetical protein